MSAVSKTAKMRSKQAKIGARKGFLKSGQSPATPVQAPKSVRRGKRNIQQKMDLKVKALILAEKSKQAGKNTSNKSLEEEEKRRLYLICQLI